MGEDICKLHIDKGLVSKTYKGLVQLSRTKQIIQLKTGRRREQTFLQRRHPDGQQTHEKLFSITHHQGNANKNHSEVSPHTCQNG